MKKLEYRRLAGVFLAFGVIVVGGMCVLKAASSSLLGTNRIWNASPLTWVALPLLCFIAGMLITATKPQPLVISRRFLLRLAIPVLLVTLAHEAIVFVARANPGLSVPLFNGWITLESDFQPLSEQGLLLRRIVLAALPLIMAVFLYLFPRHSRESPSTPHAFVMGSLTTGVLCLWIDWVAYQGTFAYVRFDQNLWLDIPIVCALLGMGSYLYGPLYKALSWKGKKADEAYRAAVVETP